jgi:plastocyanin
MSHKHKLLSIISLALLLVSLAPGQSLAAPARQPAPYPEPVVAIHASELTQAMDDGGGWYTWWHYFVMHESLKEALNSDGTPWVEVSDADLAAGVLLYPDGSPRYPIVFSLASEVIQDDAVDELRDYVAGGGFLFVGSSAFTRNPDHTTRGDFALAEEMGLHVINADHTANWTLNDHFTKLVDHRIVSHIPWGNLTWGMPLEAEQVPWGVSPSHTLHRNHYVWRVSADDAQVIANGDAGPLLATKGYGQGHFIYHGALNPLIGHGGPDPGMYAYMIYRQAIEWAFETANQPIVKLSPWQYPYDAAFTIRHDFENTPSRIRSILASAQAEHALGAQGDYYFCTGTLRVGSEDVQMSEADKLATIDNLRTAIDLYGATIGSHNGGLSNPVNTSLATNHYQYWHWGTDEALDVDPVDLPPGYTDGQDYAYTSVMTSFLDIEGWFAGLDNGQPGCGATGDCPRTWVSPYFNSAREGSYEIMEQLGSVVMGEQKLSPFPHWTLSYEEPGKRFPHVTLPVSDWYIGSGIAQSMEAGHNTSTIHATVDFYYDLGALINLYSHASSASGNAHEYAAYGTSQPRVWATNAVGVYDWWTVRSAVSVTPTFDKIGSTAIAGIEIGGATDDETAIEIVIPYWDSGAIGNLQVYLDGAEADPAEYRTYNGGLKVRVGTTVSEVAVHYTPLEGWVQTDWDGGAGQAVWADETRYDSATGIDDSVDGQVRLSIASGGDPLFSDDFTRPPLPDPVPFTWITPTGSTRWPNRGTFNTEGGTLNTGSSQEGNYGYAYTDTITIDDHSVEADIRFPQVVSSLGGGLVGRMNPDTGERYAVWLYPETSPGGTATIRLLKFYDDWGDWAGLDSQNISGGLGSGWHHVKMTFSGNQIQVHLDGVLTLQGIDNNAGGEPPYANGHVGVDFWTRNTTGNIYGPVYNNFIVRDSADQIVFSDDFGEDPVDPLLPWVETHGSWMVTDETIQAASQSGYAYVYTATTPLWTDYTVEAQVQFPSGAFGGGIGGRVDPATGAHYAAWVYPDSSTGGPNVLKLIKFRDWTNWNGQAMGGNVSLPSVGTGWHTLRIEFIGDRIRVYYDGAQVLDVLDENYDSRPPYTGGGVSIDGWSSGSGAYTIAADDIFVRTPAEYGSSGTLRSSAFDGGVGVAWQQIAWNAAAGDDTGTRVRTRTADRADHLASAPWSDWYATSGTPVTSENRRWIQYELELNSSDPTATPVFYEHGITYIPGILLPSSNLTAIGPTAADSESQVTLAATLLDDQDDPLAGRAVVFTLDSLDPLTGTTDVNGITSVAPDLQIAPGEYPLSVAFAGDAQFAPVSVNMPFTVTSPWSEWVQDTQADFQSDTLTGVDVTIQPGSVLLESILTGEGEEPGAFQVSGVPGWGYRRRLFIDNPNTDPLPAGYSINLTLDTAALVAENKLQASGNDLRVVWDDGGTLIELDRIAETPFNDTGTEIWFKTQAPIPGNTRAQDYYIYYDNPSAAVPPTDPHNVWALWEPFDGATLDTSVWTPMNSVTVSGGQAQLASGADIISTQPFTYAQLEMQVQLVNDNNYAWWGWEDGVADAPNFVIFEEFPTGFEAIIRNDGAPYDRYPLSDPTGGLTTWHTYLADWRPGHASWHIDGTEVMSTTSNVPDSLMYANFYARSVPMNIDWVRVRLRANQEPTVTLATPQPGYVSPGQVLSLAYDTQQFSDWKYLTWDAATPPDTDIYLQVRTAATQDDLGTAPWSDYDHSGLLITNSAGRWVQYRATLSTTDPSVTPALNQVTVYYTAQPATLILSPDPHTLIAGESVGYSATVDDGSQTWDVTAETTFSIDTAAGGSWIDHTYSSEIAGDWTVSADYVDLSGSADLNVAHALAITLDLSPEQETVAAGENVTYQVIAEDAYANVWDASAEASYSIDAGAGGSWADNIYTSATAGDWAVTAQLDGQTDSATLHVTHGDAVSLALSPAEETVAAGEAVTYAVTAQDAHGNIWDVTADASYSIDAGASGSWADNVYTSATAGDWTVSAELGALSTSATLHVTHGDAVSLALSPAEETVAAGEAVTYAVSAQDAHGNIWDVTAGASYGIDAGASGSWADNIYTSATAGDWTVSAELGALSDSATLHVTHGNATALALSPDPATVTAGQDVTYTATAQDAHGNQWDITANAAFSIDTAAGGSWADNVYTSEIVGEWIVTAQVDALSASATLHVIEGQISSIALTPAEETLAAGERVTYTVSAQDEHGNTWDVTAQAGFDIDAAAGGNWAGNVYTSESAGDWTVRATYGALSDGAALHVTHADATSLALSPAEETVAAGEAVTYTVSAQDAHGNTWDVTADASYGIDVAAGGNWAGNVYTSESAGDWTVSATHGTLSTTAVLHVTHGEATGLALSPDPATITAGQVVTYAATAQDAYGNQWDVTANAAFSIDATAGGSWADNVYTSESAGDWTVSATHGDRSATATLHVIEGQIINIALTPAEETVAAGERVTYTVSAEDAYGNTWDVTAQAGFDIDAAAGGNWAGNVYTSESAGDWTVSAIYGALSTTATLHVTHGDATGLALSPDPATVTAGQDVTYAATAEDAYGNTWDVIAATSFAIDVAAGGNWDDNVYTSEIAGDWTVSATHGDRSATATLHVIEGQIINITLSPAEKSVTAGERVTYTVSAEDEHGNIWDASAQTTFSVDTAAGGTWTGNVYTSQVAGHWTVTAQVGDLSATATLNVQHAGATSLILDASHDSVVAGLPVTYTLSAQDAYGNTWDATDEADWHVDAAAGGTWNGNIYTSAAPGDWTVTATYGGLSTTAALHVEPAAQTEYSVFLPFVARNATPPAPDLVVEQITVTSQGVHIVIKNQGDAPVNDAFWVDLYVDPAPVPNGVNQTWNDGRSAQGITWGVTGTPPLLKPGERLNLSVGDPYHWPTLSYVNWPLPAGIPVYVQVDSAKQSTDYGAVLESHEMSDGPYNNISHVRVSAAANQVPAIATPDTDFSIKGSPTDLPIRP